MSTTESTPLIQSHSSWSWNPLSWNVTNTFTQCYSTSKRGIATTGVFCLGLSGITVTVSSIGYTILSQNESQNFFSSYVVLGGGIFFGVVNCLGAVCLGLNLPQITKAADLKAKQILSDQLSDQGKALDKNNHDLLQDVGNKIGTAEKEIDKTKEAVHSLKGDIISSKDLSEIEILEAKTKARAKRLQDLNKPKPDSLVVSV